MNQTSGIDVIGISTFYGVPESVIHVLMDEGLTLGAVALRLEKRVLELQEQIRYLGTTSYSHDIEELIQLGGELVEETMQPQAGRYGVHDISDTWAEYGVNMVPECLTREQRLALDEGQERRLLAFEYGAVPRSTGS